MIAGPVAAGKGAIMVHGARSSGTASAAPSAAAMAAAALQGDGADQRAHAISEETYSATVAVTTAMSVLIQLCTWPA